MECPAASADVPAAVVVAAEVANAMLPAAVAAILFQLAPFCSLYWSVSNSESVLYGVLLLRIVMTKEDMERLRDECVFVRQRRKTYSYDAEGFQSKKSCSCVKKVARKMMTKERRR